MTQTSSACTSLLSELCNPYTPGSCYNSSNLHCAIVSMLYIVCALTADRAADFPFWIPAGRQLSRIRLNPDWYNGRWERCGYNSLCFSKHATSERGRGLGDGLDGDGRFPSEGAGEERPIVCCNGCLASTRQDSPLVKVATPVQPHTSIQTYQGLLSIARIHAECQKRLSDYLHPTENSSKAISQHQLLHHHTKLNVLL